MKLKKLWIKKYNKYQDVCIWFEKEKDEPLLQQELFANMNVTLFSGENGAGKTTILSFLALTFRYIQRFRERIPSEFSLQYSIKIEKENYEIELEFINKKLFIIVNGKRNYIKNFELKRREYVYDVEIQDCQQVTYDEIRKYLPSEIIVVGFDIAYHNLYYGGRYIGDRIVNYRGLSETYGTTGRGNDYSRGVLNILYWYLNDQKLRVLLNSIGIEFSNYIDIKFNFSEEDLIAISKEEGGGYVKDFLKSNWKNYIINEYEYNERFSILKYLHCNRNYKALEYLIKKSYVYINEYYLRKNEKDISISNMSTGEKTFLYSIFFMADRIDNNTIVIWEEPETHLNMMWSKKLIPLLAQLFNKYDFHILLSSHESYMIRNLFPNQIRRLKDSKIIIPNFNTFLANEVEIVKRLFGDESRNPFEDYVIKAIGDKSNIEKEEIMSILGESYLKFLLYKQMEK